LKTVLEDNSINERSFSIDTSKFQYKVYFVA